MNAPSPKKLPSIAVLRRIVAYLGPYAWHYGAAILGIGFENLFINVFMARIAMDLTRGVIGSSGAIVATAARNMAIGGVLLVAGVYFLVVLLFAALNGFQNDIRHALFRKFTDAPLAEIEARHSGDLLTRSNAGLRQVSAMFMGDVQALANALMPGVGCAVYLLMLDVRMGVVGILCGMVPLISNLPFARPLRVVGRQVQEKNASFIERMSDIMRGGDTIRHLDLSGFAAARAELASDDLQASATKQVRLDSLRLLVGGATSLSSVAFLAYASYLGIKNPDLMPAAVAANQLGSSVRNFFWSIGGVISSIQTNMGGAERILEVMDIPDEPRVLAPAEPAALPAPSWLPEAVTALSVCGLTFRYADSGEPALLGVTFSTAPGRRVALVGPSGGGKSTLAKIILGLYSPDSGEIRAFGKTFYETPLREWRELFSYVPQEPFLFAGTVYENILGGMADPGGERVREAARLANAHDFIMAMSSGYESAVDERGGNLSGGQRQRVAIARAILRDAPVLLLDEATSSLDSKSEALVQEALDRLMVARTTVVIAHRLSTVRGADEILYMAGGRILERGSHDELMDRNGLYKALVEKGLRPVDAGNG